MHLELRRKSDGETSEPVEFTYQPQLFGLWWTYFQIVFIKYKGFITCSCNYSCLLLFVVIYQTQKISRKLNWSTWRKHGTKKNLSPRQELSPWPPENLAGTLSTELNENSWRARSFNPLAPKPAVTGCKKTHQDNCLSYPSWRCFGSLIVLLLLRTNKPMRMDFLSIVLEDFCPSHVDQFTFHKY